MNKDLFRLVILTLAASLLLCIGGFITLAILERPIPDVLQGLALATLTGITGLLARHPEDAPQEVTVTNTYTDPIPTASVESAVENVARRRSATDRGAASTRTLAVAALVIAGFVLLLILL